MMLVVIHERLYKQWLIMKKIKNTTRNKISSFFPLLDLSWSFAFVHSLGQCKRYYLVCFFLFVLCILHLNKHTIFCFYLIWLLVVKKRGLVIIWCCKRWWVSTDNSGEERERKVINIINNNNTKCGDVRERMIIMLL
jgi:hypothetical protein